MPSWPLTNSLYVYIVLRLITLKIYCDGMIQPSFLVECSTKLIFLRSSSLNTLIDFVDTGQTDGLFVQPCFSV